MRPLLGMHLFALGLSGVLACGGSAEEAPPPELPSGAMTMAPRAEKPSLVFGTTERPAESAPPPASAPGSAGDAGNTGSSGNAGGAGFEWERVDAEFLGAVSAYAREVNEVIQAGEEFDKTRRALRLLAHAIEKAPAPKGTPLAETSDQIRADADALGSPSSSKAQGVQRRTLKGALDAAAKTLLDLAEGPYRAEPKVAERAREFRASIEGISGSDAVWTNGSAAYKALLQAEQTMRAMQIAIASGRVDPKSFR